MSARMPEAEREFDPTPATAAARLASLGFLAVSDLPDRPGPAYLLVALRPLPTLRHFDPETIDYWVTCAGRGQRRSLTRSTILPLESDVSWGVIRIVDRRGIANEYLTFGGHLEADRIGDDVVAAFTSPSPILRRGGHSQGWDEGAESVASWFGRLLLAVDVLPGFESDVAGTAALGRYAAFVQDTIDRYRPSVALRERRSALWTLLLAERRRLRTGMPDAWSSGERLCRAMHAATTVTSLAAG